MKRKKFDNIVLENIREDEFHCSLCGGGCDGDACHGREYSVPKIEGENSS